MLLVGGQLAAHSLFLPATGALSQCMLLICTFRKSPNSCLHTARTSTDMHHPGGGSQGGISTGVPPQPLELLKSLRPCSSGWQQHERQGLQLCGHRPMSRTITQILRRVRTPSPRRQYHFHPEVQSTFHHCHCRRQPTGVVIRTAHKDPLGPTKSTHS